MKKCLIILVFGIIAAFIMGGCATQRVWTYKADPYVKTEPLINKTVAVTPLADKRENINKNLVALAYVPIMPFGWMDLNTPEGVQAHITSGVWLFRPPEDFSKAIAEEVNNSGIFKEVFFTNRPSEGELHLKGDLKSTYYHGKIFTYCLSFYGIYLWFIGFPAGSAENNLEISLQLVESSTGNIIWEDTYKKHYSKTSWIYAMQPDFYYDGLLKEVMKEAIPSLKNKLINYPK